MADQQLLTATLIELADTLVDDFDIVDLFSVLVDRSVEILDISTAGLMLTTADGTFRVAASSSDDLHFLDLLELQVRDGPCVECHRTGERISADLEAPDGRWPAFSAAALAAGFRSAHAIPMRWRGSRLGALNLFGTKPGTLSDEDLRATQALADIGSISILQNRAAAQAQLVNDQLNLALTSRVVLEQAKGIVAERQNTDMTRAFNALRTYARRSNRRLSDVAQDVIDGRLTELG